MNTIALSAGHTLKAPGATHEGFSEYPETLIWRDLLAFLLERRGYTVHRIEPARSRDKVAEVNALRADLFLETHFNGGPAQAAGSETLYCPGSVKGESAARAIQKRLAPLFPPDRGVKEGWYRQKVGGKRVYVLDKTNCPAVIVEPEFVHHRDAIQSNADRACEAIAAGIDAYFSA